MPAEATLYDRIQKVAAQYPESRSAAAGSRPRPSVRSVTRSS
jgi:hypothetical protein